MVASRGHRAAALATVCVVALLVAGVGTVATETATTVTDESIQETTTQETTAQNESGTAVSIRNLTAPDRVRTGTDYTVSATIVNRADEQISNQTRYQIAGNVIATERVDIPANGTKTVRFEVTGNDTAGFPTGTFVHGVYTEDAAVTANVTLVDETTTTPAETAETTTTEIPATTTGTTETTPATEVTTTTGTAETPTETERTTTEVTETTTPAEATTASLTFENQSSNGTAVTVQSVAVPAGGFVVVHDNSIVEGNVVDSILGTSGYLEAGTHQNVTIELTESLNQSQRLVAVAYRDTNDNQEFDLVTSNRRADGPYTKSGSREAVNGIAVVNVDEETTNETA